MLLRLLPLAALSLCPNCGQRRIGDSSHHFTRRVKSITRRALVVAPFCAASVAYASDGLNEAEVKLAAILDKKVKEREATLGFTLDADDILELENILRTKYCGASGSFSGEPGGTCRESPPATPTCFKSSNGTYSASMSFVTKNDDNPCASMIN